MNLKLSQTLLTRIYSNQTSSEYYPNHFEKFLQSRVFFCMFYDL